jgi:hypothetical protein
LEPFISYSLELRKIEEIGENSRMAFVELRKIDEMRENNDIWLLSLFVREREEVFSFGKCLT